MPNEAAFEFVVVCQRGQTAKERRQQQAFAHSHAASVSHSPKRRHRELLQRTVSNFASEEHQAVARTGKHDQNLFPSPSPRNVVGQVCSDPFDRDTLRQIPIIGRKSLQFAYTVLWPRIYPIVSHLVLQSMQNTWRRRSVEDSLQFHAQVFKAATMCYALSLEPSTIDATSVCNGSARHIRGELIFPHHSCSYAPIRY